MLENVMKFFAVRFVFSSLSLSLSFFLLFFHTPSTVFHHRFFRRAVFHLVSPLPPFFFISFPVFFPPVLMFFYSVFVTEMHSAHSTIIKFNLTSKTVPLFPTNKFTRPRSAAMDYRRKFILVDSFRFNH